MESITITANDCKMTLLLGTGEAGGMVGHMPVTLTVKIKCQEFVSWLLYTESGCC